MRRRRSNERITVRPSGAVRCARWRGHVGLAIDHVALIHHDSRNGGDAQALMRRQRLVFGGDATLEVSAPGSAGASRWLLPVRDRRAAPQKAPLRSGALHPARSAARHPWSHRVTAVGDDHHIGGEAGRAEHGQPAAQRPGQGFASPMRTWMKMLACRAPPRVVRAIVKRRTPCGPNKQCIADCPHTCLSCANEKRRPKPPRVDQGAGAIATAGRIPQRRTGHLADDDVSSTRTSMSASAACSCWVSMRSALDGSEDARRMLVGEDHRGGIQLQHTLHDDTRIDRSRVDRALNSGS